MEDKNGRTGFPFLSFPFLSFPSFLREQTDREQGSREAATVRMWKAMYEVVEFVERLVSIA